VRVAILGAGAIAQGTAAFLQCAGHAPTLWSPSGAGTAAFAQGAQLTASGAVRAAFVPRVAATCAEAVHASDVVMLCLPGNGHKTVLDEAARHVRQHQPVIISSHLSFGALYLARLLAARGIEAPVIAWGTTLLTAKRSGATEVRVGTVREKVDLATLPASAQGEGLGVCQRLFGDRFEVREGLLAIALSNLNPQSHLAIALLNLTRMEHAEDWNQGANITPAVARLIEALDAERLAIAQALQVSVRTAAEHLSLSYHVPMASVYEMSQARLRLGAGVPGPKTANSRYVLEDVPFGLLPTVRLGELTGRRASLHEAGLAIFSAAYRRDFAAENDLLAEIDLDVGCLRALSGVRHS